VWLFLLSIKFKADLIFIKKFLVTADEGIK
jgi:hypothetical protein